MMILKRTIGPKGQVVIPKDLRRHLGVEPGSEVLFEVRDKEVVMRPSRTPLAAVEEFVSIVTPKLKHRVQWEQIVEEEAAEEIAIR